MQVSVSSTQKTGSNVELDKGVLHSSLLPQLQDASYTEKPILDFAHTAKYRSCMRLCVHLVGSTKQIRSSLIVPQQQLQYNL